MKSINLDQEGNILNLNEIMADCDDEISENTDCFISTKKSQAWLSTRYLVPDKFGNLYSGRVEVTSVIEISKEENTIKHQIEIMPTEYSFYQAILQENSIKTVYEVKPEKAIC